MATLALPITQLIPVVDQARAQTTCVAAQSRSPQADSRTLFFIARKTFSLRLKLAKVVRQQERIISALVARDFTTVPVAEIGQVVSYIDELIVDERDILKQADALGAEIRVWWSVSLVKMAAQVEYLESISESLHVECDEQASALMGMAVHEFTMQ